MAGSQQVCLVVHHIIYNTKYAVKMPGQGHEIHLGATDLNIIMVLEGVATYTELLNPCWFIFG